jgi:hypothetical protein
MSFQSQVLGMGYLVLGRGTEVLNTLRLHYISRHASLLALPLPPALVRKRRRVPLPLLDVEREQQGQGQEHRDEEEDEGGAEGAGPLVAEGDEGGAEEGAALVGDAEEGEEARLLPLGDELGVDGAGVGLEGACYYAWCAALVSNEEARTARTEKGDKDKDLGRCGEAAKAAAVAQSRDIAQQDVGGRKDGGAADGVEHGKAGDVEARGEAGEEEVGADAAEGRDDADQGDLRGVHVDRGLGVEEGGGRDRCEALCMRVSECYARRGRLASDRMNHAQRNLKFWSSFLASRMMWNKPRQPSTMEKR